MSERVAFVDRESHLKNGRPERIGSEADSAGLELRLKAWELNSSQFSQIKGQADQQPFGLNLEQAAQAKPVKA